MGWPIAMLTAVVAIAATASRETERPLPEGYKWGRCILEVDGRNYLSGRCAYFLDEDGSFQVIDPHAFWDNRGYFAYVNIYGTEAEGAWNEEILASHAHALLGTLHRRGACWVNKRARICLWRK